MTRIAYGRVRNTLRYDMGLCTGCGMCNSVCPHSVFAIRGRLAEVVGYEGCMECGACQINCPTGAIRVDSGVGCAAAMIRAALTGKKQVSCGGESEASGCCAEE